MQINPLISVIVPIYKVEEYLKDCVDSILNQTYQNLEIILVNDGSPDNCGQICEEYDKQDSRIVVIHKENGGLSDARNAGLDICKGEYISFVDSDDMIHPQFIEILYHNLVEYQADISFCDFIRFENSNELEHSPIDKIELSSIDGRFMIDNLYTNEWVPKNIVVWNKLYHHSIFKTLRFPKGLNHEDEYIFLDVYKNNPKVVYSDIKLIFYRINQNSIMANKYSDRNVISFIKVLENRLDYREDAFSKHVLYEYLLGAILNKNLIAKNYVQKNKLKYKLIFDSKINWKTRLIYLLR